MGCAEAVRVFETLQLGNMGWPRFSKRSSSLWLACLIS
jgi:hypothetical protein